MKTKLTFYPNESKKSGKTGKIPVYMRIYMEGKKTETRINAELNPEQLAKWDPFMMRIQERNSPINHQLNRLEQKYLDFITLHTTDLWTVTPVSIKEFIIGSKKSLHQNIMEFVDNYFENAISKNPNVEEGTVKQYRRAINHLIRFLDVRNQKRLTFEQLDYAFASEFKQYLVSSDPKLDKACMTEVSAATVIKKFRTIFSHAVDRELLKKNPFKMVKIKTKSPRKERLTIHQVKQIYKLDLSEMPFQEVYRDIFLFSVYTGLAYRDAMELSRANVLTRDDGNIKLVINRVKSDVITESFLPSYAISIVKKYEVKRELSRKVLPQRSNQEINQQLKLIGKLAEIPFKLSTHTARHTFRQLLSEARIADYGVIKRMMGQSRGGDVDEIYYEVTESVLMDAKDKFQNYLNDHFNG